MSVALPAWYERALHMEHLEDRRVLSGGIVMTPGVTGYAAAADADNNILVAGLATTQSIDFALTKYDSNGHLDPTFGDAGRVSTDFGGYNDVAVALAVDPVSSKIVLAGYANKVAKGGYVSPDFALARYNPDGSLDPTFGSNGKVQTDLGGADVAQADVDSVAVRKSCLPHAAPGCGSAG